MLIRNIIITIYLFWGAWKDKKELQISARYLGTGMLIALGMYIYNCIAADISFPEFVLRLLPGAVMLFYSRISKEKIGYGDGIILLILAGMFSVRELWMVWCLAFLLSALAAVWLLFVKKEEKEKKIAFLPFLWTAHLMIWGLHYV